MFVCHEGRTKPVMLAAPGWHALAFAINARFGIVPASVVVEDSGAVLDGRSGDLDVLPVADGAFLQVKEVVERRAGTGSGAPEEQKAVERLNASLESHVPRASILPLWRGGACKHPVFQLSDPDEAGGCATPMTSDLDGFVSFFRAHGFAVVRLPRSSAALLQRLYDAMERFFAMPRELKGRCRHEGQRYVGWHERELFDKELFTVRGLAAPRYWPPVATAAAAGGRGGAGRDWEGGEDGGEEGGGGAEDGCFSSEAFRATATEAFGRFQRHCQALARPLLRPWGIELRGFSECEGSAGGGAGGEGGDGDGVAYAVEGEPGMDEWPFGDDVTQTNLTLFRYFVPEGGRRAVCGCGVGGGLGAHPAPPLPLAPRPQDVHCPFHTDVSLVTLLPRSRCAGVGRGQSDGPLTPSSPPPSQAAARASTCSTPPPPSGWTRRRARLRTWRCWRRGRRWGSSRAAPSSPQCTRWHVPYAGGGPQLTHASAQRPPLPCPARRRRTWKRRVTQPRCSACCEQAAGCARHRARPSRRSCMRGRWCIGSALPGCRPTFPWRARRGGC